MAGQGKNEDTAQKQEYTQSHEGPPPEQALFAHHNETRSKRKSPFAVFLLQMGFMMSLFTLPAVNGTL